MRVYIESRVSEQRAWLEPDFTGEAALRRAQGLAACLSSPEEGCLYNREFQKSNVIGPEASYNNQVL